MVEEAALPGQTERGKQVTGGILRDMLFLDTLCTDIELGQLGSKSLFQLSFEPVALCAPRVPPGVFPEVYCRKQIEDESFPASLHPFHSFLAWSSIIGVINFTGA